MLLPENLIPVMANSFGHRRLAARVLLALCLVHSQVLDFGTAQYIETTYRPKTCLQGRASCELDENCRSMLDVIRDECSGVLNCKSARHSRCVSVRNWIQSIQEIKDCHCHLQDDSFVSSCIRFQNSVRTIICTNDANASLIEGAPLAAPGHVMESHPRPQRVQLSCISIRQRCLRQKNCSETLDRFREFCRENKKRGICLASERLTCLQTISDLRAEAAGLLTCRCHMQRVGTRQKCDRIQSRLANNSCVATIRRLVLQVPGAATSYEQLVRNLHGDTPQNLPADSRHHGAVSGRSTCFAAFAACNGDATCRHRLATLITDCAVTSDGRSCRRKSCLLAIRTFFLIVRPLRTRAMLFCDCSASDRRCHHVRNALSPACALVERRPRSCHDVLRRCLADPDCRPRLERYEKSCALVDRSDGGECAEGVQACEKALLEIQGSLVRTNCTCVTHSAHEQNMCESARRRLHVRTACHDLVVRDVNHVTTSPAPPRQPARQTACDGKLWAGLLLGGELPQAVRIKRNSSLCTDVCTCLENGEMRCSHLPCGVARSCRHGIEIFGHNSAFHDGKLGQCRCFQAEITCARSSTLTPLTQPGTFLHVGFSVSDKRLVEGSSSVRFSISRVRRKLSTFLLNENCQLQLYYQEDGHIVFEVKVTSRHQLHLLTQICLDAAKRLKFVINSRQPRMSIDAELSVIMSAEIDSVPNVAVANVIAPMPRESKNDAAVSGDGGGGGGGGSAWPFSCWCSLIISLSHH